MLPVFWLPHGVDAPLGRPISGPAEYRPKVLAPTQRSALGVRRDKAALSSGCKAHPAIRSSRKQAEQAWRRRNV
jgi:hypothetical protein